MLLASALSNKLLAYSRLDHSSLSRGMYAAARVLLGHRVTEQARTTADWLYPVGGPSHPAYKRIRFLLRCMVFRQTTAGWFEFLFSRPELLELVQTQPSLAEKVHRPYLRKDMTAKRRMEALRFHYSFLLGHPLHRSLFQAAHDDIELVSFSGKSGDEFRLKLGPARSQQKEGELTLRLEMAGQPLIRLAFSFTDTDTGPAIYIGCLQGPSTGQADPLAIIRSATKAMYGLRPRDLVIDALRVIAQTVGVGSILGVSDTQHIYRHIRKQRDFAQNYDSLWVDVGGTGTGDGSFLLPKDYVLRPLSEYPSKKRAEISRRQALEQNVFADLRNRLLQN